MSQETYVFIEKGSGRIARLEPKDLTPGEKSFRCEVTWSDGSTSEVSQKDGAKARLGGMTFLRRVYPDDLKSAWSDASLAPTLLSLLLVDTQGTTPVRVLKQRLEGSIVGGPPVKEIWDRNRKAFEALENVRVTGSGPTLTYSWRGRESPAWLPEEHAADWAHVLDVGLAPIATIDAARAEHLIRDESAELEQVDADPGDRLVAPRTPRASAPRERLSRQQRALDQSGPENAGSMPDPDKTIQVDESFDIQTESVTPTAEPPAALLDSSAIWRSLRSRDADDPRRASELQQLRKSNLTTLDQFLSQLIFDGDATGAEQLVLDPAAQLSPSIASAADIKRAIDALDSEVRIQVERALILTDTIGAEHRREWASSKGAAGQLGALARRVRADPKLDRALVARRFGRAIEALTTPQTTPGDIIDAADTIFAVTHSSPGTAAALVAGLLTSIARSLKAGNCKQDQLKRLGRRIAELPWTEERIRLASAIGRLEPSLSSGTDWLKGITANDLVSFDSLIPPLLTNDSWRDRLRTTAESAVRDAGSRRQLLTLLSSTTVASLTSAESAVEALNRTAHSDPALREWLAGIAQTDAIEALRAEVASEASTASSARELVRQRDDQIQALASRLADAQGRLALAADSHSTTRESTIAQAERDAYRLLATTLSTVETAAGQLDPESLLAKLRQHVRRRGIEPIGERGDAVAFDPALHEAPGGRPEAGSPVIVGRSGYLWIRGDQREVLAKALVTEDTS